MRFRPCIDIHNGSVKQIVGGSIKGADENVVKAANGISMQIIVNLIEIQPAGANIDDTSKVDR